MLELMLFLLFFSGIIQVQQGKCFLNYVGLNLRHVFEKKSKIKSSRKKSVTPIITFS